MVAGRKIDNKEKFGKTNYRKAGAAIVNVTRLASSFNSPGFARHVIGAIRSTNGDVVE